MKKLLLLAALALFAQPAFAADRPAGPKRSVDQLKAEVDPVQREILDLEAMYWAWDIYNNRRDTYEGLLAKSDNWIIKAETRDELFARIKTLLGSNAQRPLTTEERDLYDAGKDRIRKIINPAYAKLPPNQAQVKREKVDAVRKANLEVYARYWAWRVGVVKDVDFYELKRLSGNWIGRDATKDRLFERLDELLKAGEARPLTPEEKKLHEEAEAAIKTVLRPAGR